MNEVMLKQVLNQIVGRLSDAVASLDALEAVLIRNRQLQNDDIQGLFASHKEIVESHLRPTRELIDRL